MDMVRCLLIQSDVPKCFWADALMTACHIRNRCPSRGINDEIPLERWSGKLENLDYLKVFGCKAWAITNDRSKLEPKADEYVLIGYPPGIRGYKLWNRKTDSIKISSDVAFDENVFPCRDRAEHEAKTSEDNLQFEDTKSGQITNENATTINRTEVVPRRSERLVKLHASQLRGNSRVCYNCGSSESTRQIDEPRTVKEALEGPESTNWIQAMNEEIQNHNRNETWTLVSRPQKERVIGCKWIFRKKRNSAGEVMRFKARLVAQGFNQQPGVDYDNAYSPVVKLKSLRLLMAIAVERGWTTRHIDIVSAYLNSEIDETVYMETPDFCTFGEEENLILEDEERINPETKERSKEKVCLIKKAMYGLRQSGHAWNECMDEFLKTIGLKQSQADPCIYVGRNVILALYVDDVAIFGTKEATEELVQQLRQRFEIKDLGEIGHFLSLEISTTGYGGLTLCQKNFACEILIEYRMFESRPVATPLAQGIMLKQEEAECADRALNTEFRKIVGSLLYLAGATRPDLAYPASFLSQFNDRAALEHYVAVKHVLRYISGSSNTAIEFTKRGDPIAVYSDASWASDKGDRKSFSGYVAVLSGGAVSWSTRKQRTVALSTVEAEYLALTEAVKETLWIQTFMSEIGAEELIEIPTKIYVDNKGTICLGNNKMTSERSKHIDVRHHFLRDVIKEGKIELCYVSTDYNLADMMTKTISGKRLNTLLGLIGVCAARA